MFERFTDRARRVVVLAQEEARALQHNYIGTEHLLLGLLHERDGVGARALGELGVTLDETRTRVAEIVGAVAPLAAGGVIPFTPHAKRALESALRESMRLSHDYIGTEHMLLGLLDETGGLAGEVLHDFGVDRGQAYQQVVHLLSGNEHPLPPSFRGMPARRIPSECSFCGTPFPKCGRVFSGSERVMICEHCVLAYEAQLRAAAGEMPQADLPDDPAAG